MRWRTAVETMPPTVSMTATQAEGSCTEISDHPSGADVVKGDKNCEAGTQTKAEIILPLKRSTNCIMASVACEGLGLACADWRKSGYGTSHCSCRTRTEAPCALCRPCADLLSNFEMAPFDRMCRTRTVGLSIDVLVGAARSTTLRSHVSHSSLSYNSSLSLWDCRLRLDLTTNGKLRTFRSRECWSTEQ
jgi:hypothetical protein